MTPNLASARKAIQAELSHARQGIEYYSQRVEALETALSQLESVDIDAEDAGESKKRKAATRSDKQAGAAKRGRKPRAQADAGATATEAGTGKRRGRKARAPDREEEAGLPTTGADFWLNLVTDEPQSAVDIANAAVATIGLKPDQKRQIQKLKQRVAPALASLVSARKIQDTGAGRERRFFKGEQGGA
ncbi:MAG TPA: hypothetical protein VEC01_13105 [Noviherbaspirillum sp.]|uniref:hypothetical protein n=1 Tax=Noviherbaspirillum sp. TaxID=1926288 RepID=UPI002D688624|nr:hypothetical protein [Noviherbaspirillum sp.]HYD96260.1 hypothetical protein [Noviherbaspirillum sp.]